jgi:hypothetical protein
MLTRRIEFIIRRNEFSYHLLTNPAKNVWVSNIRMQRQKTASAFSMKFSAEYVNTKYGERIV